jgi:hypothetical protein
MKCGMKAAALGVFIAAQLVCGLPGQAQSQDNILGLTLGNNNVNAGEVVTVDGWITQASGLKITTVNASLIFNPDIFEVTSAAVSAPSGIFTTALSSSGVFTVPNKPGPAGGKVTDVPLGSWGGLEFTGARLRTAPALAAQTVFGTYTLTVRSDVDPKFVGTDTSVFFSTHEFTNDELVNASKADPTNLASQFQTLIIATSQRVVPTLNSSGFINIHIGPASPVPGPSSLIVFAMGAVPALGLLRQRRLLRKSARV